MDYIVEILKLKNRVSDIERKADDKGSCSRLRDLVDKNINDADKILEEPIRDYTIEALEKRAWTKGIKAHAQLIQRELK